MMAGHDINHWQQIERILAAKTEAGGSAQPAALISSLSLSRPCGLASPMTK
jgi:hypothetical protein